LLDINPSFKTLALPLWKCKQGHITECKTTIHYYYCKGCNNIFQKSECFKLNNNSEIKKRKHKGHKISEETKIKISEGIKRRAREFRETNGYAWGRYRKRPLTE
jgi:hypothetical protein